MTRPGIEDPYAPDEPAWIPPPPPPDAWAKWEPRARQVFILHALAIGLAMGLSLVGLVSQKTANWLLACQVPALTCAWAGLIAFLIVRSRERAGGLLERGRMLVVGLDLFTAIFTVMGFGFWLAILAI